MTRFHLAILLMAAALAGCGPETDPDKALSKAEQTALLERLAPYIAHEPEGVTGPQRLAGEHAAYYKAQAKELTLKGLQVVNDTAYYLVSRAEPSNEVKRSAVAGKAFPAKGAGDFEFFEETFWTWKMKPEELEEKAPALFEKFLEREDLTPFMNSNGVEYWIEFPNEDVRFNPSTRTWVKGYSAL